MDDYLPDMVSHPGETLLDVLEDRGLTPTEFAKQAKLPRDVVVAILEGTGGITRDVALKLEQAECGPASFWVMRERQYRSEQRRLQGAE